MQVEVMKALAAAAYELVAPRALHAVGTPVLARASLGIPDTLFIFVVALVVFGPKRLPEIGKQLGKLMFEFRRASNDFKLQIEEELRVSEQQEKQKLLDTQAAVAAKAAPASETEAAVKAAEAGKLMIQAPASGDPVEAQRPNRTVEPANGVGGSSPELRAALARGTAPETESETPEPTAEPGPATPPENTAADQESTAAHHG